MIFYPKHALTNSKSIVQTLQNVTFKAEAKDGKCWANV